MPTQPPIPKPTSSIENHGKAPEYAIWDVENPQSVINLVPESVYSIFMEAKNQFPKLFGLDEKELANSLGKADLKPSATERRLRAAFWLEYDSAIANHRKININAVYGNVCTYEIFYSLYRRAPSRVAWLLCPPTKYQVLVESSLALGLEAMDEILELPIIDAKGRVNVKLGELKAKITAMLDQRVKGGITQRLEQKTLNLNVHGTQKQIAAMDVDEMEKRIRELERKEKKVLHIEHNEDVVDAESVPIEAESVPIEAIVVPIGAKRGEA